MDQRGGQVVASLLGRRRGDMPVAPRRIVAIQPTAIGDTLIGSGMLAALARRHPEAEVIVAHGAANAAAVKMLAAQIRGMNVGFGNPLRAVRTLRALHADMIVDLCPWPFATALAARLSAPWVAGFAPEINGRGALFDLAVPHRTDRHESANLVAMAEALDATVDAPMEIARAPEALPGDLSPDNLVLLHVSAGGSRAAAKAWPEAHWVALAQGLVAAGYRVGFTGVDADAAQVDPILEALGVPDDRAVSLCGTLSLASLAEVLAVVPLLVSVDTGVLHLSAAVEGRALGLHGPTRAARWGSISPHATGLDTPHPEAGFINYGWEEHPRAMEMMPALTPDRVLETALDCLQAQRPAA